MLCTRWVPGVQQPELCSLEFEQHARVPAAALVGTVTMLLPCAVLDMQQLEGSWCRRDQHSEGCEVIVLPKCNGYR